MSNKFCNRFPRPPHRTINALKSVFYDCAITEAQLKPARARVPAIKLEELPAEMKDGNGAANLKELNGYLRRWHGTLSLISFFLKSQAETAGTLEQLQNAGFGELFKIVQDLADFEGYFWHAGFCGAVENVFKRVIVLDFLGTLLAIEDYLNELLRLYYFAYFKNGRCVSDEMLEAAILENYGVRGRVFELCRAMKRARVQNACDFPKWQKFADDIFGELSFYDKQNKCFKFGTTNN